MNMHGHMFGRLRPVTLVVLLIGLISPTASHAQHAGDRILGAWTNETQTMEIEFARCSDACCATITSVEDGLARKDAHNPDPSLRDRPLVGLRIITGLTYDDDEWSDGTM